MNERFPNTVLMTADTVGGVWTYAIDLCEILQKHHVNVHLATMGDFLTSGQKKAVAGLSNVELHESEFSLEWMDNPWEEVDAAGKWLVQLEQQVQPDLIHLNSFTHGSLKWRAPVVVVAHSCVLSWWEAVKGGDTPPEWDIYRERVRQGLQKADSIVAVSRNMLNLLNKFYGPFDQTEVIYNARNKTGFYSAEKEKIIFTMGRIWDDAKNIISLKQIAHDLPWPVYIAGDGKDSITADYENVIWLGKMSPSKAARCLSKTGIYVMPARYEPFGLSILEAALSECALVLGDIPTLREIWGNAAVYADPENPEELRYKICQLIENPSKMREKAQEARERAAFFSIDRFGSSYLDLYGNLEVQHHNQEISSTT